MFGLYAIGMLYYATFCSALAGVSGKYLLGGCHEVEQCYGSTQLSRVSEKTNAFGKSSSMPRGGS